MAVFEQFPNLAGRQSSSASKSSYTEINREMIKNASYGALADGQCCAVFALVPGMKQVKTRIPTKKNRTLSVFAILASM